MCCVSYMILITENAKDLQQLLDVAVTWSAKKINSPWKCKTETMDKTKEEYNIKNVMLQ